MFSKELIAFAASFSTASAAIYQGFNYGTGLDYATEFATAKGLVGTDGGFTSARLYTMIEEGTTNTPTSAIQAALDNDVTLLLGLWASAGQANIDLEIAALKSAIATYPKLSTVVAAISVGSEDLYRISATGVINKSGVGAEPSVLVDYINQVKTAIAGTQLSGALVGHVDTWTAWVNSSNSAVASACDFIGMDAYPYFQNLQNNDVTDAADLFFSAYDQTVAATGGVPVWVTETGWPVSGPTENLAVASVANAKSYWDAVACKLLGVTNTWWYTLNDNGATPSFGVTTGGTTPIYDLTCGTTSSSSSSSSASSTASSTATTVVVATASTTATASESESTSSAEESESATSTEESTSATATESASVTVTSAAIASGAGSPADFTSAAADSSVASFESASTSAASVLEASASSVASAAATDSTATATVAATAATLATSASVTASESAASESTASESAATESAASESAASASASASESASAVASEAASGTGTASVSAYTGGASKVRSTGGFVAAVVAVLAAL